MKTENKLGEIIRTRREALKIGLREFAKDVNLSPTFLCFTELKGAIPSEEKIKLIAYLLDINDDYLLSKAGKVSSDLIKIIIQNPIEMAKLIRNKHTHNESEKDEN